MKKVIVKLVVLAIVIGALMLFFSLHHGIPTIDSFARDAVKEDQAQSIQIYQLLLLLPAILGLSWLISSHDQTRRKVVAWINVIFRMKSSYFVVFLFIAGSVFSLWLSYSYLHHSPHIIDSHNYYLQAKILKSGHFWVPSEPYIEKFFTFVGIMDTDGRRYASSFPGHPSLLALGESIGLPWIINPLQGGFIVVFIYLVGALIFGETTGRLAALLSVLSPFRIFQCSLFMAHPTATLYILVFTWFFVRYMDKPSWRLSFYLGIVSAYLYIVRPQSAFPILVPFAVVYGWYWLGGRIPRAHLVLVILIVSLSIGGSFLYNNELTGDYFVSPRDIVAPSLTLGFGPDVGKPRPSGGFTGHSVSQGFRYTMENLKLLTRETLLWGGWTFLFVFPALFRRDDKRLYAWVFLGSGLILMGLFFCYPINSPLFGPRYYFEWMPFYILLVARGMTIFYQILMERVKSGPASFVAEAATPQIVIPLLIICSSCFIVPSQIDRYYGNVHPNRLKQVVELNELTEAIVFVRGDYFTISYAFSMNDPHLQNSVLYATDLGDEKNLQLKSVFPGKKFYTYREEARDWRRGKLIPVH